MLGGYLVGFFVLLLVKYLKVPKWAQGLMPMMIIPLLATLSIGLLMFFVVGVPIVWATEAMTDFYKDYKVLENSSLGQLSVGWLPLILVDQSIR